MQPPTTTFLRMLNEFNNSSLNLVDNNYSLEPEFAGVENIKVFVSCLSILGDLFVLLTVMAFLPLRQQLSSLVFADAFLELVFHSFVIFRTVTNSIPCQIASPVIQCLLLAQEFYFFMLCFNLYYSTKYPFDMSRWMPPLYHFVVLGLSGMTAYIVYSSSDPLPHSIQDNHCWYNNQNTAKNDRLTALLFILPVFTGYVVSLTWYWAVLKRVRYGSATLQGPDRCEHLENMRLVILWSFAYWIIVAIPFTIRASGLVAFNTPEEKLLRFLGRFLLALKGTYSGIVWYFGANIKSVYFLWKAGSWDEYMKVVDPNWVLRRQILHFATQGIQKAASLSSSFAIGSSQEADQPHLHGFATSTTRLENPLTSGHSSTSTTGHSINNSNSGGVDKNDHQQDPASASASASGIQQDSNSKNNIQASVRTIELCDGSSDQVAIFRDYEAAAFRKIRKMCGFSTDNFIRSFMGTTRERFSEGKSGSFLYYTGDQRFILKTCTKNELKYLLEILPTYIEHLQKNPNSFLCRFVGCHELIIEEKAVSFIVLSNVVSNHSNVGVDSFYDLKGSWVGRYQNDPQQGSRHVCKFCGHDFIVGWSKEKCPQNPETDKGHEAHVIGKDLNWAFRKLELVSDAANQMAKQLDMDSEFLRSINSMDYSLVIGLHTFPCSKRDTCTTGLATCQHQNHRHDHQKQQQIHQHQNQKDNNDDEIILEMSTLSATAVIDPDMEDDVPFELLNTPRSQRDSDIQTNTHSPSASKSGSRSNSSTDSTDTAAFACDSCVIYMGIIDILTPYCLRKRLEHYLRTIFLLQNGKGISCVDPTAYAERFRRNVIDVVIRGKQSPALIRRMGGGGSKSKKGEQDDVIFVDMTANPVVQSPMTASVSSWPMPGN